MKTKITVVAAALAVVLMLVSVPAKAVQPVTGTLSFSELDPCTGDVVHWTADFTLQISVQVIGDTAHLRLHESIHGTGTGLPSGDSYVFNQTSSEDDNISLVGGAGEANVVLNAQIISKGGASNENAQLIQHLTINADGTVIVDRITITDTCTR